MADKAIIQTATLTGIGDALRGAGIAEAEILLSPDEMKQKLQGVAKRSQADLTASGAVVSVPKGYYPEAVSKSVETTGLGTPSITVDANGKITSSVTHTVSGYVEANTKTATKQLPTQAGKTVTPTDAEQTAVSAGTYVTGDIKVAAAAAGGEIIESVAVGTSTGTVTVTTQNQISSINNVERVMLVFQDYMAGNFWLIEGSGTTAVSTFVYGEQNTRNVKTPTTSENTYSVKDSLAAGKFSADDFAFGAIWYT